MTQRVFGFAGWSGSGKTTLIEQVIAHLSSKGARVALIKHAHHAFDVDHPGKDSHRHRAAGASEVLISSGTRWALMNELRGAPELTLAQCLQRFSPCDLVIVEGYKREPMPKLEIWRAELGKPLLFPTDSHIVGLVSDDALPDSIREPAFARFGLSAIADIADFAVAHALSI
ncbi:MAG: molybdopterin-guanine dinucleotide biosynthesis protein B [Burkholderiales bacterium]|nr:molybdopterin-guanine dinucleotide biosynthesis protein B [Burkholderiales bacterium]